VSSVGFLWGSAAVSLSCGVSVGLAEALDKFVCFAQPDLSKIDGQASQSQDRDHHPAHTRARSRILPSSRTDTEPVQRQQFQMDRRMRVEHVGTQPPVGSEMTSTGQRRPRQGRVP
jgi:hypothetical protein